MKLDVVYNEDCLEGMKKLPDKSVNLIVIDPPYNIKKAKWDTWKTVESYVSFMTEIFKECERLLKYNGSFYWFHNDIDQIRKLMDSIDVNTSFIYKQLITWNKIDPTFKNYGYVQQRLSIDMMRNYYNGFTEYCVYYTFQPDKNETQLESARGCFELLLDYSRKVREFIKPKYSRRYMIETIGDGSSQHFLEPDGPQWKLCTKDTYDKLVTIHKINEMEGYKDYDSLNELFEKSRYTFTTARVKDDLRANSNVWLYPPAENIGHCTPKPVKLIENIIRHSSNEGDVVLDCFMGSFTTAIACLNANRHFVGYELDEMYYKLGCNRIEEHKNQVGLPI